MIGYSALILSLSGATYGMNSPPLKFKVAPNIVEDLGLNLYTSLPRVLAEFVANAYDADSPSVHIKVDFEAITAARTKMRQAHRARQQRIAREGQQEELEELARSTLDATIS